jgi:hypothetical protein
MAEYGVLQIPDNEMVALAREIGRAYDRTE